jgi:hypothetical protein
MKIITGLMIVPGIIAEWLIIYIASIYLPIYTIMTAVFAVIVIGFIQLLRMKQT